MKALLKVIGLLSFLLWSSVTYGQAEDEKTSGISLNLSYSRNGALDFFWDSIYFKSGVYSSGAPGFEGRLMYEQKIGPTVDIRIGGLFGLQGYKINLWTDRDFRQTDFFSGQEFVEISFPYVGLEVGLRYNVFSFSKNEFGAYAGGRALYFIPQELSIDAHDQKNGVSTLVFDAKMLVNPDKKLILAPNIGLFYSRQISEYMKLGIQTDVSYSQKTMMVGPKYNIYGDQAILTGRFVKRYQHISFGLDLVYLF